GASPLFRSGVDGSVMPSFNLTENERDQLALRISEAMDHLDRANAIFNYVLFSLSGFSGTDDPRLDYKFVAMANLSRIVDVDLDDLNSDTIIAASREIAFRRLPQLLCISLVSAIETCLEDIATIRLKALDLGKTDTQVARDAQHLMSGGPLQYLPRLASKLQMSYFLDRDWNEFTELVATRNVLVHRTN